MALTDLDTAETQVVLECLRAASTGPFFPDWEFHTLFGLDRRDVQEGVDAWPNIDETKQNVSFAINNSMNNLLGYPHGLDKDWARYISVPPSEVRRIFEKWRGGERSNYLGGLRYCPRRRLTALLTDACSSLRRACGAAKRER